MHADTQHLNVSARWQIQRGIYRLVSISPFKLLCLKHGLCIMCKHLQDIWNCNRGSKKKLECIYFMEPIWCLGSGGAVEVCNPLFCLRKITNFRSTSKTVEPKNCKSQNKVVFILSADLARPSIAMIGDTLAGSLLCISTISHQINLWTSRVIDNCNSGQDHASIFI